MGRVLAEVSRFIALRFRTSSLRLRISSRRSEFYSERSGCAKNVVCCPFLVVGARPYSQAPRQATSQDRCVKAEDGAAVESASSPRSISAINHTEGVGGWETDVPFIPLSEFAQPARTGVVSKFSLNEQRRSFAFFLRTHHSFLSPAVIARSVGRGTGFHR